MEDHPRKDGGGGDGSQEDEVKSDSGQSGSAAKTGDDIKEIVDGAMGYDTQIPVNHVELSDAQKLAEAKDKYWRLRLWAQAIQNIALSKEPRPGISESLKKQLQLLIADMTTSGLLSSTPTPTTTEAETEPSSTKKPEKPEQVATATVTGKNSGLSSSKNIGMLKRWIGIEIKSIETEFLEEYKRGLENSTDPGDIEFLKELKAELGLQKNMDSIYKRIKSQKEEQRRLNEELDKWTRARDQKLTVYKNDLIKGEQEMANLQTDIEKANELRREKYILLKHEEELLKRKLELAAMEELMESSPRDLTGEMDEAYSQLLNAIDSVQVEIGQLEKIEVQYEAQGPEFKRLVAEWVALEEKIETKEWVLDQLRGNGSSGNISLNDSLFSN